MTILVPIIFILAIEARLIFDPFVLEGSVLWNCWRCCGWGEYPHGPECYACNGRGFRPKRLWYIRSQRYRRYVRR